MPSESDRQNADRGAGGGNEERGAGKPTGAKPSNRLVPDNAQIPSLLTRLEQLDSAPALSAGRPPARAQRPRPPALPSSHVSLPTLASAPARLLQAAAPEEPRRWRRPVLAGVTAGVIAGCAVLMLGQWPAQDDLLQRLQGFALSAGATLMAALHRQNPAGQGRTEGLASVPAETYPAARNVSPHATAVGPSQRIAQDEASRAALGLRGQPGLADTGRSRARPSEDSRQLPRASETGSVAPSALASSRDDGRGSASACDVTFAPSEAGIVKVDMVDRGRAGGAMILKVDGLDYRAMFASDGRLSLSVPRLSRTPALVWTRADGTLCRQVATAPAVNMPLQIALIWGGAGNLDMHVVEPNAWIGSPRGHLHAGQPNTDGATASGRFSAFGAPGDPTRVQLYAVDRSLLGDSGVLNVIVKLAASDGASCVNAGEPPQLRYEIQIRHVDAQGDNVRPESRSFAFELPPCAGSSGGAERFERLTVKF